MLNKAQLARTLGVAQPTAGKYVLQGCPLTSEADAKAWHQARTLGGGRSAAAASFADGPIPDDTPAADTDLTLDEMLLRLQRAELRAGQEVENASPGADRQCALRAYNQAAKNRVEIEQDVIKLKRETRELLTPDQCEEILSALRPVVAKMDTGPQSLAFKCNPSDPELAMNALADYFEALKADFRKALGE